ncbi:MAG TPA: spore coat protein [Symbiobacteriaceae bacterium]|nr:spore coat protein [Symbiobacteriaceae bacterium]
MQFGAHEAMETHEILMEKINTISHYALYARATQTPQLREMITRHLQEAIRSYNEVVSLTRGNTRFTPISPTANIGDMNRQQVQYGLHNPQQMAPQADSVLSDVEIVTAMLLSHKNGAKSAMWASLECADPNLRRALLNSAVACNNHAYEVFLFMNQQGIYQVPTLNRQTADTLLHTYQPAGTAMTGQFGQFTGAGQGIGGYTSPTLGMGGMTTGMVGQTGGLGLDNAQTQYRQ